VEAGPLRESQARNLGAQHAVHPLEEDAQQRLVLLGEELLHAGQDVECRVPDEVDVGPAGNPSIPNGCHLGVL
jgi:hypothetical protein